MNKLEKEITTLILESIKSAKQDFRHQYIMDYLNFQKAVQVRVDCEVGPGAKFGLIKEEGEQ